jgi:hypothetical protein
MLEDIAESDLQTWFEDKSRKQTIIDFIVNPNALNTIPKWQRKGIQHRERLSLLGLDNAKKVFDGLKNAKHLSGNRSISTKGHTQLRPDLILISEDANYLLVELKTRKETERQAVQELLAYSAAMKMQLPFTNEFMFIFVAFHWDTLLKFSVQSLIMDGKLVLPLALELSQNGEYQLRILQSLFDSHLEVPYDPFYAMVPHTLATTVKNDSANTYKWIEEKRRLRKYFQRLTFEITAECHKAKQSGFVLFWMNSNNRTSEIFSLTVVTVNQFWEYGEHNHNGIDLSSVAPIMGIKRVQRNAANLLRDNIYSRTILKDEAFDELEDVFLSAEAWQEKASLYAQSSFSLDLIKRHIDSEEEETITQNGSIGNFEPGAVNNLKSLLSEMQELRSIHIDILSTFGDVSDFLHKKNLFRIQYYMNFTTFQKLMGEFRNSKVDN